MRVCLIRIQQNQYIYVHVYGMLQFCKFSMLRDGYNL